MSSRIASTRLPLPGGQSTEPARGSATVAREQLRFGTGQLGDRLNGGGIGGDAASARQWGHRRSLTVLDETPDRQ